MGAKPARAKEEVLAIFAQKTRVLRSRQPEWSQAGAGYFHRAILAFAVSDSRPTNSSRASGAVSSLGASTFVSHVLKSDSDEKRIRPTRSRAASLTQRSITSFS